MWQINANNYPSGRPLGRSKGLQPVGRGKTKFLKSQNQKPTGATTARIFFRWPDPSGIYRKGMKRQESFRNPLGGWILFGAKLTSFPNTAESWGLIPNTARTTRCKPTKGVPRWDRGRGHGHCFYLGRR